MFKYIAVIALALVSASCWYSNCGVTYAPVCGSNNVTYNNACLCRRAGVRVRFRRACATVATVELGNNWDYNWGNNWNNNNNWGYSYSYPAWNSNWGYGLADWGYSLPVSYSAPATTTTYVGDAL